MERETARSAVLAPSPWHRQPANLDNVAHADDNQHDPQLEALDDVSTGELEGVFLLKPLEHGALDLDELVREEKRQESVGIRVYGHVECNDLVEKNDGMQNVVHEGEQEHSQREHHLGAARAVPRQRLGAEETLEHVLAKSREKPVPDFEEVINGVQFDGRLCPNKVVHPAGIEVHKRNGTADDDGALEQIGLVERR